MKKLFFLLAISSLLFASCNSGNNERESESVDGTPVDTQTVPADSVHEDSANTISL